MLQPSVAFMTTAFVISKKRKSSFRKMSEKHGNAALGVIKFPQKLYQHRTFNSVCPRVASEWNPNRNWQDWEQENFPFRNRNSQSDCFKGHSVGWSEHSDFGNFKTWWELRCAGLMHLFPVTQTVPITNANQHNQWLQIRNHQQTKEKRWCVGRCEVSLNAVD